jgi:hypothetical protein
VSATADLTGLDEESARSSGCVIGRAEERLLTNGHHVQGDNLRLTGFLRDALGGRQLRDSGEAVRLCHVTLDFVVEIPQAILVCFFREVSLITDFLCLEARLLPALPGDD